MRLHHVAICLALAMPAIVCAAPVETTPATPGISAYLNPATSSQDVNDTQAQLLTEAGQTLGFQGGKAQRAQELLQALDLRAIGLDRLYTFSPLISAQGWLPPVITAAESLAHITPDQLRTANRSYDILVPERFVSNPPGWRQYLRTGLSGDAPPPPEIRPKNAAERKIWQAAVEKGWLEGRESADRTLESNFNRLTRDFTGMIRYSTLLQQGMMSRPVVTEEVQTVTGKRDQMTLGDRVRNLKTHASFELNKSRWKPTISVSP